MNYLFSRFCFLNKWSCVPLFNYMAKNQTELGFPTTRWGFCYLKRWFRSDASSTSSGPGEGKLREIGVHLKAIHSSLPAVAIIQRTEDAWPLCRKLKFISWIVFLNGVLIYYLKYLKCDLPWGSYGSSFCRQIRPTPLTDSIARRRRRRSVWTGVGNWAFSA